jgi:hypothetical protein
MKRKVIIILVIALSFYQRGSAQVLDIIGIVTDKVIKAIDMKVQELQNQTINLQIIQKQTENELSRQNLKEIGDWVEKQKDLYKDYYASLKQVKPLIAGGQNILRVVQQQKELSALYELASSKTKLDARLTEKEKTGIISQYTAILDESTKSLSRLQQTISSNSIQLSDADRIKLINQYANQLDGLLYKLQTVYSRSKQVSLQRARDQDEINAIRQFYGFQK